MFLEFFTALGGGFLGGIIGFYLFTWTNRRWLYNLSVDVADLQERHLRSVRKAAAKERWEEKDDIDEKLLGALTKPAQQKGWTKWPSLGRSENSSAGSSDK